MDFIQNANGISRKEAIKRMGKYAAISALGSYIILNPQKAQAQSAGQDGAGTAPPDPSGQPFDNEG